MIRPRLLLALTLAGCTHGAPPPAAPPPASARPAASSDEATKRSQIVCLLRAKVIVETFTSAGASCPDVVEALGILVASDSDCRVVFPDGDADLGDTCARLPR